MRVRAWTLSALFSVHDVRPVTGLNAPVAASERRMVRIVLLREEMVKPYRGKKTFMRTPNEHLRGGSLKQGLQTRQTGLLLLREFLFYKGRSAPDEQGPLS